MRHSGQVKSEILEKIRGGRRVSEVAVEYGVRESTVRSWIERDIQSPKGETLEISRLKRENEALLRMVGQLSFEADLAKKKRDREVK